VERFPGGFAFKTHKLLYHSTLGLRVIKKRQYLEDSARTRGAHHGGCEFGGVELAERRPVDRQHHVLPEKGGRRGQALLESG
jgi:hypothetical protein